MDKSHESPSLAVPTGARLLLLVLTGVLHVGCTKPPAGQAGQQDPTQAKGSSELASSSATPVGHPSNGSASTSVTELAPIDWRSCAALSVENTLPAPDAGVAMNNAMTAKDAGSSDRLTPVMQVVDENRNKFLCCFEPWGKQNVGKLVQIALTIQLDPDGKVTEAKFKQDETEINAPQVETCMSEVARSLSYPASPGGFNTKYVHRFRLRGKK